MYVYLRNRSHTSNDDRSSNVSLDTVIGGLFQNQKKKAIPMHGQILYLLLPKAQRIYLFVSTQKSQIRR